MIFLFINATSSNAQSKTSSSNFVDEVSINFLVCIFSFAISKVSLFVYTKYAPYPIFF